MMSDEINLQCSLNTILAWGAGLAAVVIVFGVASGMFEKRWGLLGGLLIALAHGLAMRHWIHGLAAREIAAFELGRESVRNIR